MSPLRASAACLSSAKVLVVLAGIVGSLAALGLANVSVLAIVSGLIIVCSSWLMQRVVGVFNLRVLTIPGIFYLMYFGIVLIPSFFVYANQRNPIRLTYLFAVESAMLIVPLGILFSNLAFRFDHRETTAFYDKPVQLDRSDPNLEVYLIFLFTALFITSLYAVEVRTIPLFQLMSHAGEYEYLGRLREDSLKLLDSRLGYVYSILGTALYPLLIVYGFGQYLLTRRLLWGAAFLVSLSAGVLFAGFTIAKAPVAALFVMLSLYFFAYRSGKVKARFIVGGLVVIFLFPIFVDMQVYAKEPGLTLGSALLGIGQRMFYTPAEVLYFSFEVFPNLVPYQHGRTIGMLAMLLGEEPFDAANIVGRYYRPGAGYSITGNAPFLGNLNADFGMVGVLVGAFLAGVILQTAQILVVRGGKSVLGLAIYAIFLFEFHELTATSLPIVIMSAGPTFILLLAWMMRILSSSGRMTPTTFVSGPAKNAGWVGRQQHKGIGQ